MTLTQSHNGRVKVLEGDIEGGTFHIQSLRFSRELPINQGTFDLVMPGRFGKIEGVVANRRLYPVVPAVDIHDLNNWAMVA